MKKLLLSFSVIAVVAAASVAPSEARDHRFFTWRHGHHWQHGQRVHMRHQVRNPYIIYRYGRWIDCRPGHHFYLAHGGLMNDRC